MENRIENLLSFCSQVDFGAVNLSVKEKEFCNEMNDEVISLCKSLPEPAQIDAIFFLMRYFRIPIGQELSIFMHYYVPAWSIIYWLIQSADAHKRFSQEDKHNAKIAHAMALLLHPLDDHLNDGQLEVTHLALLLRSQSWMIMNNAFKRLVNRIDGGEGILQKFIGDYYSSIIGSEEIRSLDSYCDNFRKQMATWMIVPVLMTKKIFHDEEITDAVQNVYESFGIAWRLLDDIKDIETDMMQGSKSSVYACLPENIKMSWDKLTEDKNTGDSMVILDYLSENSVIDRVRERISRELDSAASISEYYDIKGLADEFRCLAKPLKLAGTVYEC